MKKIYLILALIIVVLLVSCTKGQLPLNTDSNANINDVINPDTSKNNDIDVNKDSNNMDTTDATNNPDEMPLVGANADYSTKDGANTNIYFTINDVSKKLSEFGKDAIGVRVSGVNLHSEKGWIYVAFKNKDYDLVKLNSENTEKILFSGNIPAGNYDKVELSLDLAKVKIGEKIYDAILTSKILKMNSKLVVSNNNLNVVVFDFIAVESVHDYTASQYLFAPVVKFKVIENPQTNVVGNSLTIIGGTVKSDSKVATNYVSGKKVPAPIAPTP